MDVNDEDKFPVVNGTLETDIKLKDLIEDLNDPENMDRVLTEILCHNRHQRCIRITVMTKKRVSSQAKKVLENEF